jgi:hypothetical protein
MAPQPKKLTLDFPVGSYGEKDTFFQWHRTGGAGVSSPENLTASQTATHLRELAEEIEKGIQDSSPPQNRY